uniref:Putative DNA polymerase n=1 Tax=viral metagenome TaxID=1070528 RepID=A0A6M3JAZ9_9ZZZZ
MIKFQSHPDCTKCSLCESASNPGIPTRPFRDNQPVSKDKVLLIVGQNPGVNEDRAGKSWIGYTGQLLGKFIEASELEKYCDIYLANACRCRHPQGGDITQAQVRACRDYLFVDILFLLSQYEEVIIFAIGAKAVYSVTNNSALKDVFKKQGGTMLDFPMIRVFSTFHLAMLHPLRKPALVRAVESHFVLLRRYLEGQFIPNEEIEEPELGISVPDELPDVVSCDIETYGILKGVEQTVFNPIKSKYIDGVDFPDQVICINFSWRDLTGIIHSAEYVFSDSKHLQIIRQWFRVLSQKGITLVGQNVKFDLMYLASADRELRYWIDPRRLKMDDTLILSFLLYEQQPEKGLKELSMLFGISDYQKIMISGGSGNAKSPWDKELHKYNGVDGVTTLKLREELLTRLVDRYGEDSEKLSDECAWMRNAIVWDTFDLDLNGSALDVTKLEKFHNEEQVRCQQLLEYTETEYGIKLAGRGSDKPLRQFFLECVEEADLIGDSRVQYTDKTKNISIGVENANLLKKHLPEGIHLDIVSNFQEYKERSKIVNTYTKPLLSNPRQGIVIRNGNVGMVFPSWYPIPSYFERGGSSDDKVGGQTQGRFSCKKPARQTEPHSIRDCSTSRWRGGKLVEYDYNQDHLRMAALLSGDPPLMEIYQKEGESVHLKTAADVFPDLFCSDFKKKYPKEYTACKSLNFLVIFKGGPEAFQKVVLGDAGVELELSFCQRAINVWYNKHPVYKEWQDRLIDLASKQGYLVLPTGWSRTFGLGPSGVASYTNEICNFMHQTPCAQLLQSAHYQIIQEFRDLHLKTLICLQIYDALFADIFPGEEEVVDEIIIRNMEHPYVLDIFYRWAGREIPWVTEKRVYE